MKSRRSWRQRGRQMYRRGNRPGTQTGLRGLVLIPRRRGDSSGESLQPGFYVAISSKKKVKTLHSSGLATRSRESITPPSPTQEKSPQTSVRSTGYVSGVHGTKVHKTLAITQQTR